MRLISVRAQSARVQRRDCRLVGIPISGGQPSIYMDF